MPRSGQARRPAGVLIFAVLLATGVIGLMGGTVVPPEDEEPMYEITVSESLSHLTFDDDTNQFVCAMSFNDTSDAFVSATNYIQANFSISRADVLDTDAITQATLGMVQLIDVSGADDEYICDQNADDTFKVKWTKLGGTYSYEDATVRVEAGDSNWVLLNITLNAPAVAAMNTYETAEITFTLAGEVFSIDCIKAVVVT
jgi:hypothetical protein